LAGVSEAGARWRNPERSLRRNFELVKPLRAADSVNRLSIALVCYVALGALTWATITEPKLRLGTLLILGLFAVKSIVRRGDAMHPDKESEPE
jgi:hypothetical protein